MDQSRPTITSTAHILPFERLSPVDFERLCLWLVEREGYERARHLGLGGSEQGRDVVAYKPTPKGEELWYFQCKRYQSIGAATLKGEVDKYIALAEERANEKAESKPDPWPTGVVFVVSSAVTASAEEDVAAYCMEHGLAYEFWAQTELDEKVKSHPEILREFFNVGIWSIASGAITDHWKLLLALLLTNGMLFLLMPTLQARLLVAPLAVVCVAVLASLTIIGWSRLANRQWLGWQAWSFSASVSVLLIGVLFWQIGQAVFPQRFSAEEFGIVVAYFGEGHDLGPSKKGREIAYDIVEKLNDEAQKPDAPASVRARAVGIVQSSEDAKKVASRYNANLVVWGRLVVGEEAVTVHFKVVEPMASGSSPEYPRVLPIGYTYSAEVSDYAADIRGTHHFDLKDDIAGQSSAITYFVLGLAHHLDYEYQDAILMFEEAKAALKTERSELDQESAADLGLIHYYLGKSYQWLGLFEKAVIELELAADMNREDPATRFDLAYCYQSLGRIEEADATLQEAVTICNDILSSDPENLEARYDLGLAYQALKENDKALATYERLIDSQPKFYAAYVSAGAVHADEDRFEESEDMYKEAIKRAEDAGLGGAEAYLGLAEVYRDQKHTDLALENYLKAVEPKPEHAWVHYRLAQLYKDQGDIDLAWEEYEKVVQYSDNEVWAYSALGEFLRDQKLYDLAIESYETARKHDLDDVVVQLRLGEVYLLRYESQDDRQEGDDKKAEEAFAEALDNVPDYFEIQFYIYAGRGRLYYAQQRYDLAAADFEKALEWNPSSPQIQFSLARSYDDAGNWKSACAAYRKILEPELKAAEDSTAHAKERIPIVCTEGE